MPDTKPLYFMAIDNGTQSVRAMVFDQHGQLMAKSKVEIEPYVSPEPGWAEQSPDYFWASLCRACEELWPQLSFPRDQIKAVSVTTQRATVVPLNSEGEPVRPAISWLDQRQVDSKPKLGFLESMVMRLAYAKPAVDNFHAQSEANWMAQNQPELWQQVHKYLLLSGYYTFKLTGQYTDAIASQVGYIPFDYKQQQWAKDSDWRWRAQPVRRDMLPTLVPAGGILGHITAEACRQTGIPCGLTVVASGSDKACEVLGSGGLVPGTGSLSYGTTATVNVTTDKYREALRYHPPYPGVVPNTFNAEMIVLRGYWMVRWFKEEFGLREQQIASEQGVSTESLFDELLAAVPPGAMGLMLQPYWSAGPGNTGAEAKGAIIGFGDVHTRAHVYRALIEGLTYALREGKEVLEKRSATVITRLRVSGGGSQSDHIMQITADIFGMTVERPHTFETSGLGAAIAAAVGVGCYPDFESAVTSMTHAGKRFEPQLEHQRVYDALYKNVYRKMYSGLRPTYRAIKSITGYPR